MKLIIGSLITLVSVGALAFAPPGWHAAPNAAAVATAVTNAIDWTAIKCTGTVTKDGKTTASDLDKDTIKTVITNATQALIKDDASQPLIKFELTGDDGTQHFVTSIVVTTTADRKSVVKLDAFQKVTAQQVVNTGTLDQPTSQTVTVDVQETTGTCQ